jgi:hypothetical protein
MRGMKGLPYIIAILLVVLNFFTYFIAGVEPLGSFLAQSNLLLHVGVIIAIGWVLLEPVIG